jgi:hypothetical protein
MPVCVTTTVLETIGTKRKGAGTAFEGEAPFKVHKGLSAVLPGTLERQNVFGDLLSSLQHCAILANGKLLHLLLQLPDILGVPFFLFLQCFSYLHSLARAKVCAKSVLCKVTCECRNVQPRVARALRVSALDTQLGFFECPKVLHRYLRLDLYETLSY